MFQHLEIYRVSKSLAKKSTNDQAHEMNQKVKVRELASKKMVFSDFGIQILVFVVIGVNYINFNASCASSLLFLHLSFQPISES